MSIGDIRDRLLPEDRYISATVMCPNPEHWHSLPDGQSTEIEVSWLIGGLVRGLQPGTVVETGSHGGQTTEIILRALDESGRGTLVTCEIDPERRAALAPHPRLVVLGDSLQADLSEFAPIDFCFFDSVPEIRVREFERYWKWMRVGTIVAFHDTASQAAGGQGWELRAQIEALNIPLVYLPTPRGLALGEIRVD